MKKSLTTFLYAAIALMVFSIGIPIQFAAEAAEAAEAAVGQACQKASDCGATCEFVCVQRVCQRSGLIGCAGGGCAVSAAECSCSPQLCNRCSETCGQGNDRQPACITDRQKKTCPDGSCVPVNVLCPTDCAPTCDPCTQECQSVGGQKRCVARLPARSYCPAAGLKGICVTDQSQCPERCTPACDSCLEECQGGSCKKISGRTRCADGSCNEPGESCPPIPHLPLNPLPGTPIGATATETPVDGNSGGSSKMAW